jgi:hypothetical protein
MAKNDKDTTQISTLDDMTDEALAAPAPTTIVGSSHDDALSGEKVNIIIHEQDGDAGQEAVFVGVNGVGYQIPRGKVVAVPVEVLHVLDNSVQKIFQSLPNGETQERSLRRFNHQSHGKA